MSTMRRANCPDTRWGHDPATCPWCMPLVRAIVAFERETTKSP